jgi:hypothetical protein
MHRAQHHPDLRQLVDSDSWFATIALPAPSRTEDAARRLEVTWSNARRQLSDRWSPERLAELDAVMADVEHDRGEAIVVVAAIDGPVLVEALDEPIHHLAVGEGPLPRLATVIEGRQRAIAHVVVETDRTGADIIAFDGASVIAEEQVEGDTEHIHRGRFGGWSHRRFQQRAENTWERNARDVASAVVELAERVDARVIAVAGEVRAQTLVLADLPGTAAERIVRLEAGDADGIASEVVRELATVVAEDVTELSRSLHGSDSNDRATIDADEVMRSLEAGRVEVLAVRDDGEDGPTLPDGTRLVDAAIAGALRTDAEIVVVPDVAVLDGPLAARLRW